MNITLVKFKAFDSNNAEAFVNKSFDEIAAILKDICFTHVVQSVQSFDTEDIDCIELTSEFEKHLNEVKPT